MLVQLAQALHQPQHPPAPYLTTRSRLQPLQPRPVQRHLARIPRCVGGCTIQRQQRAPHEAVDEVAAQLCVQPPVERLPETAHRRGIGERAQRPAQIARQLQHANLSSGFRVKLNRALQFNEQERERNRRGGGLVASSDAHAGVASSARLLRVCQGQGELWATTHRRSEARDRSRAAPPLLARHVRQHLLVPAPTQRAPSISIVALGSAQKIDTLAISHSIRLEPVSHRGDQGVSVQSTEEACYSRSLRRHSAWCAPASQRACSSTQLWLSCQTLSSMASGADGGAASCVMIVLSASRQTVVSAPHSRAQRLSTTARRPVGIGWW